MNPLLLASFAMLLPVAQVFASPTDAPKDDIMLPVLHDDPTGPNYIDMMNQAKRAMADAQRRVDEQKAAAWTFDQASAEFKDGPGQIITLAADMIESIRGRWTLSARADAGKGLAVPALASIEFSHEGFRLQGDKSWRRYEGGIDGEMMLEQSVVTGPTAATEDFHVTRCSKPSDAGVMVCRTQTTRKVYGGVRQDRDSGRAIGSVTSFAKYVRVKP